MSAAFTRSSRTLEADSLGRHALRLIPAVVILGAWLAWAIFARVGVHVASLEARLEVDADVHALESPADGRVVATVLRIGLDVAPGDVLVELDDSAQRLALDEDRARAGGLDAQATAVAAELTAARDALRAVAAVRAPSLAEARERRNEADALAAQASESAERATKLRETGVLATEEGERAVAGADARRAAASAMARGVEKAERDADRSEKEARARVAAADAELARVEGERSTLAATIARDQDALDRRKVRAPVAGTVGEDAGVRPGSYVEAGDSLGAIVPRGEARIVASFAASDALGRMRPGQVALLRLDGFPWTEVGAVPARVTKVAEEPRDGRVRVELAPETTTTARVPLGHGLTGRVEVEVERASPLSLALRAAGRALTSRRDEG